MQGHCTSQLGLQTKVPQYSSGGYKPKVKVPVCRFHDSSFLGLWAVAFSLYPHREEGIVSSPVSLLMTLILWDQSPTLMTSYNLHYFHRGFISKYSHTGLQHMNVGRMQPFSP